MGKLLRNGNEWSCFSGHFERRCLSIENYLFAEAKDVYPISYLADYDGFDGSLGLAPSSALSVLGMPNPFNMMMEQGILDENLFALKLPRGVLWAEGEDGE